MVRKPREEQFCTFPNSKTLTGHLPYNSTTWRAQSRAYKQTDAVLPSLIPITSGQEKLQLQPRLPAQSF